MRCTAGIDVGSAYTKVILLAENNEVVGRSVLRTGFNLPRAAMKGLEEALCDGGLERDAVIYVASTGYGRYMVPFRDVQITELTSHARGAFFQFPATGTVVDVGAQGIKSIRLDERGRVKAFRLNDKCAAGSGAFLEKTAKYMGYQTEDIGRLAMESTEPVTVSSVCAVFAESEVINHLTAGMAPGDIMNGAVISLAGRAVQLVRRVGLMPAYTLTGGMSLNPAFVRALEQSLGAPVNVPPGGLGYLNGALGASVLAWQRVRKTQAGERVLI